MPPTGWNIGAMSRAFDDRSDPVAEAGLQQRPEVVRIAGSARGVLLVGAIRGVEVALADQEGDEPLLVLCGQRHVERVLVDRLGHQLAGVADHVGLHLAQPDALAGQRSDVRPLRSRSRTTRSR